MPLYKHRATFASPLKGLSIVPEQPPEPPEPTFSQQELQQQVEHARKEGMQMAQQQLNPRIQELHQQAVNLQSGVLQTLENNYGSVVQEVYERMPALVHALLQRVLIEVKMTPETVKAIVLDTLSELSSEAEQMEVRLCPSDLKLLQENDHELDSRYPHLSFRQDNSLKPGDCLLHSRFGLVDARVETKLQKILEDLKGKS